MQGHISAIHASSFFHVFSEDQQLEVAQRLASLLSPTKGSVIFGSHIALPEKGWLRSKMPGDDDKLFCHSPESWKELWDGQIFKKGTVKVVADFDQVVGVGPEGNTTFMSWSITRT